MCAETLVILLFLSALCVCILTGLNVLAALGFGFCCLFGYCLYKGHPFREILSMFLEGMLRVKNILLLFLLIGCLTATWRLGGTIPWIIVHSLQIVQPTSFIPCCFLLCCLMSFLTGTSFGTASTMGVLCMLIAASAGLDLRLTGGAVLSGCFFGDRCSPMSSSAQLVCTLTKTDIYSNIRGMLRTGLVPFVLTALLYLLLGSGQDFVLDLKFATQLEASFALPLLCVLPAVLILVLSLFRVNVKLSMLCSILTAAACALFIEGCSVPELLAALWQGYRASDPELATLMNGGGIASMLQVSAIVLLSSSFSGVFSHTALLDGVKGLLTRLGRRMGRFGTVICTSVLTGAISCNQSLGTILTAQLCEGFYTSSTELALALENSIIVIAALIPWSIAGAVPVATIGAPQSCLLFAFFLYLVPAWNLVVSLIHHRH